MKTLWWGILLLIILGIIGFVIYESQPMSPLPSSVATSTTPADLPEIIPGTPSVMYQDPQFGFSIYYPSTTILKTTGFDGFLPVTQTPVIGLALDPNLFQGTNLTEAGVYIGATTTPSIVAACLTPSDANETVASSTMSINGTVFAEFTSSDAGAGNIYQEKAFRVLRRKHATMEQ